MLKRVKPLSLLNLNMKSIDLLKKKYSNEKVIYSFGGNT